jgi:hypothetical protein
MKDAALFSVATDYTPAQKMKRRGEGNLVCKKFAVTFCENLTGRPKITPAECGVGRTNETNSWKVGAEQSMHV